MWQKIVAFESSVFFSRRVNSVSQTRGAAGPSARNEKNSRENSPAYRHYLLVDAENMKFF